MAISSYFVRNLLEIQGIKAAHDIGQNVKKHRI